MSDGSLVVPPTALRAGVVLDERFRIEADLGDGPLGRVFRARNLRYEETITLHVVRRSYTGDEDEDGVERLLRALRRAQAVVHPSVARIGGVSEAGGFILVEVEHVEGQALSAELARRSAIPVPVAVRIATELFEGLAAAHDRGVVHRDVHAGTIVVLPEGRIKLMALGMSPALETAARAPSEYRSPEQLIGAETDFRTDLYAGGIVLFQMLTGAKPFRSGAAREAGANPLEALPPSSLAPLVNPLLDALVLRLLSRDRERRPTSARAVATELRGMRR